MNYPIDKVSKKLLNKLAKRLLTQCLDGFYYFEDDDLENRLDKIIQKLKGPIGWRKKVRIEMLSDEKVRRKIQQISWNLFGGEFEKDANYE